jgi:hypothetical protein
MSFTRVTKLLTTASGKKVIAASIKIMAADFAPNVYITDIQLQGGNILTGWRPHDADVFQSNMFGTFAINRDYIGQPGRVIG